MGLAVSNAIFQRHYGYITVTSESQQGTTVDLYLPVQANASISRNDCIKLRHFNLAHLVKIKSGERKVKKGTWKGRGKLRGAEY